VERGDRVVPIVELAYLFPGDDVWSTTDWLR